MTDYLGNDIHEGDLVLFNERNSNWYRFHGYRSYFSTGNVERLNKPRKGCVTIDGHYHGKKSSHVLNLTALGVEI